MSNNISPIAFLTALKEEKGDKVFLYNEITFSATKSIPEIKSAFPNGVVKLTTDDTSNICCSSAYFGS